MAIKQLALWDDEKPSIPQAPTIQESKEAYERRRCIEMAEKLNWPALHHSGAGKWTGITIEEGEAAWREFFARESDNVVGIVMLQINKRLNPLKLEFFEKDGLYRFPVEDTSRIDARYRARMLQLAETLAWPHLTYWSARELRTVGPGEQEWQKYYTYGCSSTVGELVVALERRVRGEEATQKWQQSEEEDEC